MTEDPNADLDAFLGRKPPSRRARLIKWGGVAIGVVLLVLLLSRCVFGGEEAVRYATVPVERGDLRVTVSATGNLQPTNQVNVGSEQSGLITDVLVRNNDRVTKGQVLARLDTARLNDALTQSAAQQRVAEAQVATADATAQQSRANLRRLEEVYRLSGGKVPSQTELDTARAEAARGVAGVRSARAAVAQAQAQVSSNRTNLSRAIIVSPVTGVVLSRQVEPGQTVAASFNTPTLFTIAEDLSRMELQVKVDEADVGQVKEGQRATFAVDAYPGRTFPARIERVDVGANATAAVTSTGTTTTTSTATASSGVVAYTAILSVTNPELQLRPGMTASADIVTAEKRGVLLVPNAALRFSPDRAARGGSGGITSVLVPRGPRRGGGATREVAIGRGGQRAIYLLGEDGQPMRVQVTVGDTDGSQTEVSGPDVRAGVRVITGQLAAGEAGQASPGGQGRGQDGGGERQPGAPAGGAQGGRRSQGRGRERRRARG